MPPTTPLRRPAALAAAAMTILVLVLALATTAGAAPATLNVDAVAGQDTNPGTATLPLKTLGTALKLAAPGATVKLAAGVYGPGFSGDQYPAGGLAVPSGVTIDGGGPDGSLGATLLGSGSGVALNLAGDATVRNLVWGGQGFGIGILAKQGTQSLSNLFIGMGRGARGPAGGGVDANGAVLLRGTAQATLTNSTIFLLSGNATGVSVNEQARLTMDGGTITAGDQPNCESNTFGIELNQSAQATLTNMHAPGFRNIAGTALKMTGSSKATLSEIGIGRALTPACASRPSITVDGAAALTMHHSVMQQATGPGTAIAMGSSAPLQLLGTTTAGISISGYDTGIDVGPGGTGSVTTSSTHFDLCKLCLDAQFATGPVTVTNSSFRAGGSDSVGLAAPSPKVRGTEFNGNGVGVLIYGPSADLGTASSPGNNDFRNNRITAVRVEDSVNSSVVSAVGNQWEPGIQSADSGGHYTKLLAVTGLSAIAQGQNFDVQQFQAKAATKIRLASSAVGRLRLAPHVLHARGGKPARLKMSWTHPKSWKQLRTVTLRVYRGAKAVGTITVRPHSARLSASGAIEVVAGDSRITHHGKTVTAKVAVRLSRSLAGAQLRVAVEASDRNGRNQLEPSAAVIRVAR